jgi:glycosyltransferase involved in cell wall biosynthesis
MATLGRLIEEKDFVRAVRVTAALRKRGVDVGLIVIGQGTQEVEMRSAAKAEGLREAHEVLFKGEITDSAELARTLYCADLCINPGCLGLSVVDCLFSGLPVLSVFPGPRGPYHGPEWANVIEGRTGWLARDTTDEAVAQLALEYLSRSANERARVEQDCMDRAESTLGIGPMVDGFLETLGRIRKVGGAWDSCRTSGKSDESIA